MPSLRFVEEPALRSLPLHYYMYMVLLGYPSSVEFIFLLLPTDAAAAAAPPGFRFLRGHVLYSLLIILC